MIKDALEYLAGLARSAAEPKRLDIKDPRRAFFVSGDGETKTFDLGRPPRAHKVKQLADLIALADSDSVVWYDESAVVLVMDDSGHRCETATLDLVPSDLFVAVAALRTKPVYDHKGFIRLLKITLAGTISPSALLDVVRRVKFDNGSVTHSEVKKSRESLGREITSSVSAEAEIPDAVTLSVPVYKTLGEAEPYPIRCTVEIDPMEASFRLLPFPDEIERVQQLAMGAIAERLAACLPEGVPAYYGRP